MVNNEFFTNGLDVYIDNNSYIEVCENLKRRIIRILYLKDDYALAKIKESDLHSYIYSLTWDLYGAYVLFNNYKFLNCICELEGIKKNIYEEFARKKILDLANYIANIPPKEDKVNG